MRSITKIPSGEISALATSIPKKGAMESWMTSPFLMRSVPLTFVAPLPSKSMANAIFAVKASHPPAFTITFSTNSDSVIPSMEWVVFNDFVDEQEAINTTTKVHHNQSILLLILHNISCSQSFSSSVSAPWHHGLRSRRPWFPRPTFQPASNTPMPSPVRRCGNRCPHHVLQ